MIYCRKVDGLRVLAVISVILFHAGVSSFQGQFVGVDFFVFSAFPTTNIILDEKRKGVVCDRAAESCRLFNERGQSLFSDSNQSAGPKPTSLGPALQNWADSIEPCGRTHGPGRSTP